MIVTCIALRFVLTIMFLGSCVVFVMVRSLGTRLRGIEAHQPSSIGWSARSYLIGIWSIAHCVRGLCAGIELFVCSGFLCPGAWGCQLMRCIADLPYWSSYTLFVLFLGNLSHTVRTGSSSRLLPIWTILNIFIYGTTITITILAIKMSLSYQEFEENVSTDTVAPWVKLVFAIVGSAYLSLLVLLILNSRRLRETIGPSYNSIPPGMLQMLDRFTIVVALICIAQTIHYFSITLNAAYRFFHLDIKCKGICIADFIFSLTLEILPTYIGMMCLKAFQIDTQPLLVSTSTSNSSWNSRTVSYQTLSHHPQRDSAAIALSSTTGNFRFQQKRNHRSR